MKRILSVILSLALLASALIIPMSVSADNTPMDPTEAYNQLNAAVDGLELDLANIQLTQVANPDRSITAQDNYAESGTVSSVSDVSDESLTSILGSKYVKISANNTTTGDSNGLIPGHVHAVEYPVTSDANKIFARDIGYIVLYVNTNRSFKMSLGVHDFATGTPNIINGDKAVSVSANAGNYQAVVFNLTSVDWVNGNGVHMFNNDNYKYYANRMYLSTGGIKWYFPSIQEMTDGQGDIAASDDIHFGSIFYVPVDTNVRYFKFDYDISASDVSNRTIAQRFDSLSPQMIAAAEMITNDDGRYTDESFAELQTAIANAKATLINDKTSGDDNALALFKAEVANLYKLEEVFRPKFVDGSERAIANVGDVKNLSEYQRSLLGEHYIKIKDSDFGKEINFVDVSATGQYPATPVKDYTKYRDIYLYVVNNTGSVYCVPTFNAYIGGDGKSDISFYDKDLYVNSRWNSFKLDAKVNRCDLFDLNVNAVGPEDDKDVYHNNDVRYFVKNYTFDNGDGTTTKYYDEYKGSSRIQWIIPTGDLSGTSNLILGSMMGEIAFDTTGDKDLKLLNSKESIFGYYSKYITGQGYINTDDIESTLSAMGAISIPVTGFYEKYATIEFTGNYSFAVALQNAEVTFKVNPQEGATVKEVIYGGEKQTVGANGVYTIVADASKTLEINLNTVTTEFGNNDVSKYFVQNDTTNIALGKTPHVFLTNRTGESAERTLITGYKISNLSNDDYTTDGGADVSLGINFCTDASKNEFLNGYVPYKDDVGANFDFTKAATEYQAYVDIIYDLGTTADIYKVQQMSYRNDGLQLGLYEVYASEDINDLFNRTESLVVSYQNKTAQTGSTETGNEQHEFPTRSARFVAFRVYSSTTYSTRYSDTLRTRELAIYGTITGDYTVSEKLNLPSSDTLLTPEAGAVDLLNGKKATVEYTDDGGTTTSNYPYEEKISVLTDGHNIIGSHKDFYCATYQSNGTLYNGYTIERNADVNIKFTRDTNTPMHYTDFTFELDSYYKVTDFGFYHYNDGYSSVHKVQAFNVYIGNDKTNLYTDDNLAITCENYFNSSVHEFKFNKTKVGKYIGVRVLMSNLSDQSIRIAEIAAYGKEVGAPDEGSKLAPAELTSKSGYIYNKGGSSVFDYTSNSETVQGTALRLTVGYKSPKVSGGADASKIILKNGAEANVIERNVIAIAKSKYNSDQDFNIHTEGASVTVSTATSTKHPVSNYFKSEAIKEADGSINQEYRMAYGALNINNISKDNASKEVVVRGRVVYEYDGKIYAVYSDIVGVKETVSAQAAFDQLPDPKPTWFK